LRVGSSRRFDIFNLLKPRRLDDCSILLRARISRSFGGDKVAPVDKK
jgi:hypothetical protein